ncbi:MULTISPECIES: hypothetical protein [Streptomyces]|nr:MULTISPECIES: hypothetical protein [Streptomyces]MBC2876501.1 hypothetical protein [Streptomyces sp. TYQ1024]UBI40822.1 hypothetical protein K7I03_33065 [Streptomyces mobaraensis]
MPKARPRAAASFVTGLVLPAVALAGCASRQQPRPATPDDVIKAATQRLTDACLARQGLNPQISAQSSQSATEERRVTDALFGAGRTELSVTLPTGYVVRAHSDGCLAAAQRRLYGDQPRWFRASVIVDNLKPEADRIHRSLAEVRDRHRTEIADWRRMRARALTAAATVLDTPPPTGEPQQ